MREFSVEKIGIIECFFVSNNRRFVIVIDATAGAKSHENQLARSRTVTMIPTQCRPREI